MSASALPDLSRFGLAVGHASDEAGATGITVIRGIEHPLRAGVAVFGRATGSRELPTASADHRVNGRVDAIVFTGGSAYGLDAVGGVMRWMEERGRGFSVRGGGGAGGGVVPIVPAAVVFDLAPFGRFDARPTPAMAYEAAASARSHDVDEGSVGAGTGTTVGKMLGIARAMKGGFGCASISSPDDSISVAAMAVVNAVGDVRDAQGTVIAGARDADGRFADVVSLIRRGGAPLPRADLLAMQNTTLALVASSVPLAPSELTQLARAAGAALFRRITPVGSSSDGDVVFAVSPESGPRGAIDAAIIETFAVAALEDAIERAVRRARGRDGIPGLADDRGN